MIDKNQVLELVCAKGYVVPSDLIRQFHVDTFIMGAVLSDLVHDKKLAVSSVKIGGSPVYYPLDQKEKLVELSRYLNEKDRQTFAILQEQKVLLDEQQTPLIRVSLRNIKDYAKPIEVTANGVTHLFWKWYLASEQEVHALLKEILIPLHAARAAPLPASVAPVVPQVSVAPIVAAPSSPPTPLDPVVAEKKKVKKILAKQEMPKQDPLQNAPLISEHFLGQQMLTKQLPLDDAFAQEVSQFFTKKGMRLTDFTILKKGEIDCLVEIPSPIGSILYFCKAKNKKKCSEGEVATAFVAAQLKKLPAMLLTPGELPKKVQQKIITEYPNMKVLVL